MRKQIELENLVILGSDTIINIQTRNHSSNI